MDNDHSTTEDGAEPSVKITARMEQKTRRKTVRYSRALGLKICDRIACGETLRQIERDDEMPNRVTIVRWANRDVDGFAARYDRARRIRLDLMADEIIDIADDARNDWMEIELKNGESQVVLNKEAVARSRLRVDSRKWMLSKLLEDYSDKVAVAHTSTPVEVNHSHKVLLDTDQLKALPLDELARLYREEIAAPAASVH